MTTPSPAKLSDEDLNAMKALAAKATPGPWRVSEDKSGTIAVTADIGRKCMGLNYYPDDDAAHIARCDPQTISSLIDEVLELRASEDMAKALETARAVCAFEADTRGELDADYDQSARSAIRVIDAALALYRDGPSAQTVALVTHFENGTFTQSAVFSDEERASAWAEKQPGTCVVVYPMVIDDPDFGNVPRKKMS